MKIQFISYTEQSFKNMTCCLIDNPLAFDSFDVNIIDLSHPHLWRCNSSTLAHIKEKQNFNNLKDIISNSHCKNIIIILPQDCKISYYYSSISKTYVYGDLMRNNLDYLMSNLKEIGVCLPIGISIGFENNKYLIRDVEHKASFYFKGASNEGLQFACDSNKTLTIKLGCYICTFLNIRNEIDIHNLLFDLNINHSTEHPSWLNSYIFYNDSDVRNDIEKKRNSISELELQIEEDEKQLKNNAHFKTVLCTNGGELVSVVFEILDLILNTNLNTFIDEKREDFTIKESDITFIGEIKGVSSNVKNEHISQVDNHLSLYEDKLEEEGTSENLKKILIINHQRYIEPSLRNPINEKQIHKAQKEDVLIIETTTLLKIFEKFLKNEIDKGMIIKLFKDKVGVLDVK